ncbi:MAG: hypothetical protein IJ685_12705 [Selenomonadaceae bacterium]|nr:hypothetical protein [Selenomonadaceae bacterium]
MIGYLSDEVKFLFDDGLLLESNQTFDAVALKATEQLTSRDVKIFSSLLPRLDVTKNFRESFK